MERPADECPFPKPFPSEFSDCPAFQSRQFIPLDTRYQPLDPVITCRHLETRALPQRHRIAPVRLRGVGLRKSEQSTTVTIVIYALQLPPHISESSPLKRVLIAE